jgi:hypothetical protein
MNRQFFLAELARLGDTDLARLANGQYLRLVEDQRLAVGEHNELDVMRLSLPDGANDAPSIRRYLEAAAGNLVDAFYREHPLSESGFKNQVSRLIDAHGAQAFAGVAGERADVTLFVDGGEVIAETRGNPRHPYGAFLELDSALDAASIIDRVQHWLASGEAYRQYLSMNVCRYNC